MFRSIACTTLALVTRLVLVLYLALATIFIIAGVVAIVAAVTGVVLSAFVVTAGAAPVAFVIAGVAFAVALASVASAIVLTFIVLIPAFFLMRALSCPLSYFPNPSDPFDFLRLTSLSAAREPEQPYATGWPFPLPYRWFPWSPISQELTLPTLGGGFGLLELLFLPNEQISKLHPSMAMFVDCLRKCLCAALCQGEIRSSGGQDDPGKVVVDTSNTLLEDLKAQLDQARKRLEEAQHKRPPDPVAITYWTVKITELTTKIAQSGG